METHEDIATSTMCPPGLYQDTHLYRDKEAGTQKERSRICRQPHICANDGACMRTSTQGCLCCQACAAKGTSSATKQAREDLYSARDRSCMKPSGRPLGGQRPIWLRLQMTSIENRKGARWREGLCFCSRSGKTLQLHSHETDERF